MLGPRNRPTSYHSREIRRPKAGRPRRTYTRHSARATGFGGSMNSSEAMRPPGLTDAGELAQGRRRVLDVAKQVGEGQVVELAVLEWQRFSFTADELDARGEVGVCAQPRRRLREHLGTLVESHDPAAVAAHQGRGDHAGAGRHVEHAVLRPGAHLSDHRPSPARILAEAESGAGGVVAPRQTGEQANMLAGACRPPVRLRRTHGRATIAGQGPGAGAAFGVQISATPRPANSSITCA